MHTFFEVSFPAELTCLALFVKLMFLPLTFDQDADPILVFSPD